MMLCRRFPISRYCSGASPSLARTAASPFLVNMSSNLLRHVFESRGSCRPSWAARALSLRLPQCHDHQWPPLLAVVGLLVMRREDLAVIGEYTLAAVVHGLPRPRTISEGQCFGDHVPRMIKKVRAKVTGTWVVSNDLEPAHFLSSDATIRGVDDELPTWPPLVHVAREDPHRGRFRCGHGLALRKPSSDEDLEGVGGGGRWVGFGHGLPSLQLVMRFGAPQGWGVQRRAERAQRAARAS